MTGAQDCKTDNMPGSFAHAVEVHTTPSQAYIDLDTWAKRRALLWPRPQPEDVDLMDSNFVAFHSSLKRMMQLTHGLLVQSTAFDLHEAIAPCCTFADMDDSSSEDDCDIK